MRGGYDDALPLAARLAERERTYAVGGPTQIAPPRVVWLDAASRSATVVEVRAHDSQGLLYRLTRVLADAGMSVRSARIRTLGAEAVDTFYLADGDGPPTVDGSRRATIEDALLAACEPAGRGPATPSS